MGAHITMGLGHMVPNPNLEYIKVVVAVGENVLKDGSFDWATNTVKKLPREKVSSIRTVETKACVEQWLVDFLKDKVISTKFGL